MARTFIRQGTQIRRSDNYADNIGPGGTLESGAVTIEDDLNSLRSQLKRVLDGTGTGRWYDDLPVVNGKKRSIADLNTALNAVEERKILVRTQVLTDVAVPADQNYVVLSVADNEAPTQPVAIALTADGAVVAAAAGAIDAHELVVIEGTNALNPKNLVLVRDAANGQPIQSGNRDVYGLLQVEAGAVDGDNFDDAGPRARISFVRPNAGFDALEACPAADIGGRTVNYVYAMRMKFDGIPEDSFLGNSNFTDLTAMVDVTLDRALDNQGATPATTTTNVRVQLATDTAWRFENAAGDTTLFGVNAAAAGTELQFNGATLDINNTGNADFAGPVVFDSGASAIRVGVTPGYFDTAANNLGLRAGGQLFFDDAAHAGSTWTQAGGVKLSDGAGDWNNYAEQFGEVSLLGAVYQAAIQGARVGKFYANVTSNIPADADIGGANGGANLDAALPDMSAGSFVNDYDVYINGELQRPGVDAGADNDYYPGTSLAAGQLRMEFPLNIGDVICVVPYVHPTPAGA